MKPKRRYYSLIDKVYQMDNLYEAWLSVKKNQGSGGIDGVSIAMFEKNMGIEPKGNPEVTATRSVQTRSCQATLHREGKREVKTVRHSHNPRSRMPAGCTSNHRADL